MLDEPFSITDWKTASKFAYDENKMETYHGNVKTPQDAIILFEACRQGLLPRVQRRLSEKERQSIKSGSVFVWDEREAGMRRWTDGKSWSASRVSGSFLTYREMEGKKAGNSITQRRRSPHTEGSDDDPDGPDGYRYKPDGLMKQSFSITTVNHQKLHLISYFARSLSSSQDLMQPSADPQLKNIRIPPGMYPESTVHEQQNMPTGMNPPAPMMSAAYAAPLYTLASSMGPDPRTIVAYNQAIPTSLYPSWPAIPTTMSPIAQHAYIARSLPTSSPLISMAEPLPQPMVSLPASSVPAPSSPPKAVEPAVPVELRPLRNSPEPTIQKPEGGSIMDIPSEKFVNVEDSRVIRALDKNLGLLNEQLKT